MKILKTFSCITMAYLMLTPTLFAAQNGEVEEFFYNRGYKSGYDAGYDAGYKKAMEAAKDMLLNYKEELKAFEIGKYLVAEHKITAPQIWQVKDDSGSIKISVRGCKIEDELSIADLFSRFNGIPKQKTSDFGEKSGGDKSSQKQSNENSEDFRRSSVTLSDRDGEANVAPDKANRDGSKTYLNVKKSDSSKSILDKANVVYSEDETTYRVLFFNRTEKENFCDNFTTLCK